MCSTLHKLLTYFFLISSFSIALHGQAANNSTPRKESREPTWVNQVENSVTPIRYADGPRPSTHYLRAENQVDVESQTYYSKYIYQITSEEGLNDDAQISINFNPVYQQLVFHRLNIHRAGEVIDQLDSHQINTYAREEGMESQLYDGRLTANILLEGLQVDDIIEYAYTLTGDNPIFGGKFSWTVDKDWAVPVEELYIRVRVPNSRTINYWDSANQITLKKVVGEQYTEYLWNEKKLPAVYSEGDVPSHYSPWSWIDFSEYQNYEEVVEWALPIWENKAPLPPMLQKKHQSLLLLEDPKKQIIEALRYVQSTFRYTGIFVGPHSFKPYPIEQICQRRFGDCKDKTRLLIALLQALGLEAYPAFVHTRKREAIIDWLPTPVNFNHVVTAVELDGKTYWLDPTRSYQGGSLDTVYFPAYAWGLKVKEGTQKLTAITPSGYQERRTRVEEVFDLGKYDETHSLEIKTYYYGADADSMRGYIQRNSLEEIERDYIDYYEDYYPGIEIAELTTFEDNLEENIFIATESYLITEPWHDEEEDDHRYLYYYAYLIESLLDAPDKRKREMPFAIAYPKSSEHSIQVKFPEEINFDPDKISLDNSIFSFSLNHYTQGDTLYLNFAYQSKKATVSAEETASYLADYDQAKDNTSYSVWVNKDGLDYVAPVVATYTHWGMVYVALTTLIASLVFCAFLLYLSRPNKQLPPPLPEETLPEFQSIGGWLVLPAIILFIRPIVECAKYSDFITFLDLATMQAVSTQEGEYFAPTFEALLYFELSFAIFSIVYLLALNFLFYKRNRLVPKMMIGLFLATLFFTLIDEVAYDQITAFQPELADTDTDDSDLPGVVIAAFIWVPYFLVSERVKATFIK